ncbi:Barwin-related endoglucanase [Penicillium italicum]|uniref:Barwin-related endoglucanase n=1 Tax=Penicillium italicum TaxID=40296 RepID=A0A0A2KMB1_PENIT|nr:Barwin-related endoglucanase [Penicillium italicum]
MKYLRLASVAALVSAATVSAGPLGAREYDGYCPKGYTMSVYYKTVTVETYPTATSVESTATPTSTPVTVESESSAKPTVASSSTAIAVETTTPVAVVQVETTTSSAPAVETSVVETSAVQTSVVETSAVQTSAVQTSAAETYAAETSAAETSAVELAVVKTAPAVAVAPTSSAETAAAIKTVAAPVVETTAAAQTTAQPPVEVASTSTSSATSSSSTESASNKSASVGSSSGFPGEATFYGGNIAGGTCSFSGYTLPSNLFGTALSLQRWDDAASCGACVSVTGPKGNSIKAMIVDQCPECESNHLDLFQDAFAELSDISAGVIKTTWSYVSCDLDGPLQLKNKEGTSAYWFAMQVVNANEVVTALDVSTDGGSSWKSTTRSSYNFFENSAGFGTSTVDVRITGASGNTVIVKDVGVSSGTEVTAGSNL